jgi:hypothetical protein
VHKVGECSRTLHFHRADHFHRHLNIHHAAVSTKWITFLVERAKRQTDFTTNSHAACHSRE